MHSLDDNEADTSSVDYLCFFALNHLPCKRDYQSRANYVVHGGQGALRSESSGLILVNCAGLFQFTKRSCPDKRNLATSPCGRHHINILIQATHLSLPMVEHIIPRMMRIGASETTELLRTGQLIHFSPSLHLSQYPAHRQHHDSTSPSQA